MSARKTGWIGAAILAVGLCASFAEAATNTLVNGATDWRLPGSYAEANVDYTSFTSADVLQIPADATVYIDLSTEAGVASLAVLNSVERIVPLSTNSVLDVTVPEGTESAQINVPISYAHIDNTNTGIFNGELVKRGVGELALEPPGTKNNELQTKITVKTGTLVLPQTCPNGQVYVSAITVDEGATLVTARNNANDAATPIANTVYKTLNGAGTITNRTPSSAGRTYALEAFSNNKSQCGTFTGKITGAIQVFNSGYVNLTGTESDCPGDFWMSGYKSNSSFATNYSNAMSGNYATHISKLANRRQPSSIGAVTNILVEAMGHNLIYDGEGGDSSDVPFTIYSYTNPFILDGGATGGLSLSGKWTWTTGASAVSKVHDVRKVMLTGSNTQECVIGGQISDFRHYSTNVTAHFCKSGSGTWRFSDRARSFSGGFAIEAGTLKYDSIANAGVYSSLGLSTNLFDTTGERVDYAFRLGGGTAKSGDADEPTFAYSGTNDAWCAGRPFAVKSDARIVNDTTNILRLVDAYGLGSGTKTLTFGGAGAGTNEFWDIADGEGTLAVRKTGAGNWTLAGNLDFSGGVTVDGGSLTLRKTDSQYTWYRWTLQASYTDFFSIEKFALFSEDKVCLNEDFTEATDWRRMQPGQIAFGRSDGATLARADNRTETLKDLVVAKTGNNYGFGYKIVPPGETSGIISTLDNTDSYIPIVMRLTNGTPEIAYFDYVNVWYESKNKKRCVKAYTLEGSVNGIVWDTLYATNAAPVASSTWSWTSSDTKWLTTTPTGYAISPRSQREYAFLENLGTVSVSGGGVLKAEGGSPEISSLALDATSGGTINGFTFAADGTLDVANMPSDNRVVLPVTLTNATGAANLSSWAFRIGGERKASWNVGVDAAGQIVLSKHGTSIIIR